MAFDQEGNAMNRYRIRVTNGTTERWTIFAGEDELFAHMNAMGIFAGTGWRVGWPIPMGA